MCDDTTVQGEGQRETLSLKHDLVYSGSVETDLGNETERNIVHGRETVGDDKELCRKASQGHILLLLTVKLERYWVWSKIQLLD